MTSLLMNCPQCGVMIPKEGRCEDCHWTEPGEEDAGQDQRFAWEYARRRKIHGQNYAIFMGLMFGTGLLGLLTAYMWIRVIYLGDVSAFVLIGVLTVGTFLLSGVTAFAKKLFPVDLNCPACNLRLDELGVAGDYCPGCDVRLK